MPYFELSSALSSEVTELAKTLASIPSPTGFEGNKAQFVKDWLWDHCHIEADVDDIHNVTAYLPGDPGNVTQLYLAHIDTVFQGVDVIEPKVDGNSISAPSIGDNSCNAAALMVTLKAFVQNGRKPKENRIIAFNVGEEGLGNLCGVRAIMKRYPSIGEVISIDATTEAVICKAVGSLRYRVEVLTCGGHSYSAFGNPSAIHHAANIIQKLYGMEVPKEPKTTYNVGIVEGGTSVNTIAQRASMLIDLRSEDAQCLKMLNDKALAILEEERSQEVEVAATLLGERPCGQTIANTSLLDRIMEIRKNIGLTEKTGSGSTDCNLPLSLGIPSVCFGVYQGFGAHTMEETIFSDSIALGLQQLLTFFMGDNA